MVKLIELADDFEATLPLVWNYGTAVIDGGQLSVPMGNTEGTNQVTSVGVYDLTQSAGFCETTQVPTGPHCEATFALSPNGMWGSQSAMFWYWSEAGVQGIEAWLGGQQLESVGYSYNDHRWLRINLTDTTMYWETSPNGLVWSTFCAESIDHDYTGVHVHFGADNYGSANNSGAFVINRFNVRPTPTDPDDNQILDLLNELGGIPGSLISKILDDWGFLGSHKPAPGAPDARTDPYAAANWLRTKG